MDSLENEFRKLDVCQSNRQEDISNRQEAFAKSTVGVSLSPLDLFIRDLDERKGKLPCCQEVSDIQTSVERFLKSLLLEVEKELPFYKTTLVKSGSFYEATKVSQPDEFDYFVQLDNFSGPEDIRFEELPHCMVAVIPSESAFEKFIKTKGQFSPYSPFISSFQWKRDVKTLFIDSLRSKLAHEAVAFGLKVLTRDLDVYHRNGPAYTLELEWQGGQLYTGLTIKIDLSVAVKINSYSSTMAVDFESETGKVVKSLLHASPAYYFAVSGYTQYDVPPSNLFKELEENQKHRKKDSSLSVSLGSQSDCLLRISQSCLEQSLFRDHFGPDGGPSVCLRVLKVLRDMTRAFDEFWFSSSGLTFCCKNGIDQTAWEFITAESVSSNWQSVRRYSQEWTSKESGVPEPESTRWISSYTVKTLVLFEWSAHPEDEQWTGSNLSQRLVNIVTCLLHILKRNKGLGSFWYHDYCILPHDKKYESFLPEAINRVTTILRFLTSGKPSKYSFEQFSQNLTSFVELASQKQEVTKFVHFALEKLFRDRIMKVLRESIGERKKRDFSNLPKRLRVDLNFDILLAKNVFSSIYIQALLNKIAPDEELILSYYSEYKKEPEIFASDTESHTSEEVEGIVKRARELFREIARERMSTLDTHLPDYSLWSADFKPDEMAKLLKLLCENFKKDLEILSNKLRSLSKEEAKTPAGNGVKT